MLVVSTAGHVDHGKSALVRALTGMEPDRLAEEHRRGLTIELGYVWTDLVGVDGGRSVTVAFVDVPGHQRFIGTMLAGIGPVATVLLVVAADAGWSAQTTEHLAAIEALAIGCGVVAITRCDLADPAPARAEVQERLARSALAGASCVEVSARTGHGLTQLRAALVALAKSAVPPPRGVPADLWVDRAFSVRGSGTVVTGTLASGRIAVGDSLNLAGSRGVHPVVARRLQALGRSIQAVEAPARVAVNLRGVPLDAVRRGDRLLGQAHPASTTPRLANPPTALLDVAVRPVPPHTRALANALQLHVGTASCAVQVRALDAHTVRLTCREPLPVMTGDRAILREPARREIVAGAVVLDANPPPLGWRGDARRRAAELRGDPAVHRVGGTLLWAGEWRAWGARLKAAVDAGGRLPPARALAASGMPHPHLLGELAGSVGLVVTADAVASPLAPPPGVTDLLARLTRDPFDAPSREELAAASPAAAVRDAARAGQLLLLPGAVVLGPGAVEEASTRLRRLGQPFTTSEARQALGTSRRVVVPLLEHLDSLGLTRRLNATRREALW